MRIPDDQEQAQDYIDKLDNRWSSLRTSMAQDAAHGKDTTPKSLLEAYQLASNWKVSYTTQNGHVATVFATQAFVPKAKGDKGTNDDKSDSKSEGKGKDKTENESIKTPTCYICGENHHMKNCPYREEVVKLAKERSEAARQNNADSTSAPTTTRTTTTTRTH